MAHDMSSLPTRGIRFAQKTRSSYQLLGTGLTGTKYHISHSSLGVPCCKILKRISDTALVGTTYSHSELGVPRSSLVEALTT